MRICFNEMTVMKAGTLSEHIRLCGITGFPEMEILTGPLYRELRSGRTLAELKTILADNGVRPASLNAVEVRINPDKASASQAREKAILQFALCRELGCDSMEALPAAAPAGLSEAEIADGMAESLADLGDLAAEFGLTLALEFLALPGKSISGFAPCRDILRKAGRKNVGMLLDSWHFQACGAVMSELDSLKPGEIVMAHVSDCPAGKPFGLLRAQSLWPGEGCIDFGSFLGKLKQLNYQGPVSLEIADPAVMCRPAAESIEKAYRSMKTLEKRQEA